MTNQLNNAKWALSGPQKISVISYVTVTLRPLYKAEIMLWKNDIISSKRVGRTVENQN